MLSTLVRYDGWFLVVFVAVLVAIETFRKRGYKVTEGTVILFATLGGFGILLWFGWNLLIFGDPLYFAFGPFSAHTQQLQLESAGDLQSKMNIFLSAKTYLYALLYNSYTLITIFGTLGFISLILNKKESTSVKIAILALIAPLLFNILALFTGHSVLFVQGITGNTWFNVRYGLMLAPTLAIFAGYLVHRLKGLEWVVIGLSLFTLAIGLANYDAVTIDDARVGSSQKNVTEVSGWLGENAADKEGFVLISVASHDAIVFSSGLPMGKFIHEGTGIYWDNAQETPENWARWVIMRTHDENDLTFKLINKDSWEKYYTLVDHYPFADIYQLNDDKVNNLITEPIYANPSKS